MTRWFLCLVLVGIGLVTFARETFARENVAKETFARETKVASVFDFRAVMISEVVSLYFEEVAKRPYIICSDVLADVRPISIRAQGKQLDQVMLTVLLDQYGYEAREESGVVVVCKKREEVVKVEEDAEPFIYQPRYREVSYLVDLVSPLVKGVFANKRSTSVSTTVGKPSDSTQPASSMPLATGQQSTSSQSMSAGRGDDYLIFRGQSVEVQRLRSLLGQLDIPTGEVLVKGYLYEVGKNETDGSALNLVFSLLNGKLSVDLSGGVIGNTLKIKTGSLDFVAAALKGDSRFKIVTSSFTRVRSGATATLQVGQDVPVLGAIVTSGNGQSQQSVEYRQSGVIIDVLPHVHEGSTDLDLSQTVSDFVQTETGLSATPTLNKREIRTSLAVEDGEVIVIGGLNQSKAESGKTGLSWLPFDLGKSSNERSTELVLLLELRRL
ncbi:MAG: hypothetical protein HGA75_00605 [Thiobacillus sp.]|nr:hypothetical protein [Thiobacillus sp.]